MYLAELVTYARIEQDPLGRSSLAGVDMSHDSDIACFFKCVLSGHLEKNLLDGLPSEVGKSLVGLCHLVSVFAFFDGCA